MAATKKKKKSSKSTVYKTEGDIIHRTRKACPKCGPGVFLGEHATRSSCGNCGFLEWKK
ncbi:MAG: 30S ribosomal protein S27ae [Candidatus Diapherotrites archaeon]